MTTYHEDIYPSEMHTSTGKVWVFALWTPTKKWWKKKSADMPVMVFAWWNDDGKIVAMGHQSLQ